MRDHFVNYRFIFHFFHNSSRARLWLLWKKKKKIIIVIMIIFCFIFWIFKITHACVIHMDTESLFRANDSQGSLGPYEVYKRTSKKNKIKNKKVYTGILARSTSRRLPLRCRCDMFSHARANLTIYFCIIYRYISAIKLSPLSNMTFFFLFFVFFFWWLILLSYYF